MLPPDKSKLLFEIGEPNGPPNMPVLAVLNVIVPAAKLIVADIVAFVRKAFLAKSTKYPDEEQETVVVPVVGIPAPVEGLPRLTALEAKLDEP